MLKCMRRCGGARSAAWQEWWHLPEAVVLLKCMRRCEGLARLRGKNGGTFPTFPGELLEVATYYPNGARETLRANSDVEEFALEPVGFTGKEDDSEVGLVYFGMRYLMPHLGRWASPDPLQIHAGGGGEFGNSYHYVSGNLLQARDPLGLCACGGGGRIDTRPKVYFSTNDSDEVWDENVVDHAKWLLVGETSVDVEEVKESMEDANRGDIVVFEGHGDAFRITEDTDSDRDEQLFTTDMITALLSDGNAPSVVIMGSCQSADVEMQSTDDGRRRTTMIERLVDEGGGVA